MYDFAFDKRSLGREFIRSDFSGNPNLIDEAVRDSIVDTAVLHASSGFPNIVFDVSRVRGKDIYQTTILPHDLILRKLSRNIKIITKVRQSDRNNIIKSLVALLEEGHPYRIYKLDIKQFYESFDTDHIEQRFASDPGFPTSSLFVFHSLRQHLIARNISGLPRGLAISATLSEYAMRPFDAFVRRDAAVYFYARYVDDIVIITTGAENKRKFMRALQKNLPQGLNFNYKKSHVADLFAPRVRGANLPINEASVDFLGYRFNVMQQTKPGQVVLRTVTVDIAPRKIIRFKTRIVLSILRFIDDGIFIDLLDRLRLLTGNYNLYDFNMNIRRNVGIYWNYRQINISASTALPELDAFLKKLLLARSGRIAERLAPALTAPMRRQLLTLGFSRSFSSRAFYHFGAQRMAHLVQCWSYE